MLYGANVVIFEGIMAFATKEIRDVKLVNPFEIDGSPHFRLDPGYESIR